MNQTHTEDVLWPRYAEPADIADIEAVPLAERGLPVSTYALLRRAATLWPDRTALRVLPDGDRWQEPTVVSFGQLLTDVHRTANLLHHLGVDRHSTVALIAPNCAELVTATLAAQLAGVAAPINAALSLDHITELLRRSGARVLITAGPELDPATWATARQLATARVVDTVLLLAPTGETVSSPEPLGVDGLTIGPLHALAMDFDGTEFTGIPPSGTDLAAVFHTGGTTGAPKLAAHTHTNEVTDAWMIAANTALDEDSVVFAALPLFHVNALVVTLLAPLFRGQSAVWAGPLGYRDPMLYGNFWKIVERYQISAMSAVPTVYAVLSQCPVDADISSLQYPLVGASALPPSVRTKFAEHTGLQLLEGYGLTEATCASVRSFTELPRDGAVGQRLPYQHLKAVDIDDDGTRHDLPAGQVGHLVISGPCVFPGYVVGHDGDEFRLDGLGALVDGWLDTGDLAMVDAEGFVHLRGRAKDLIIRGGHNIDPVTIEDALLTHPDVTGAAAVGRPDIHAGEVPVAYVTLTSPDAVSAEDLCSWATARVPERAAAPKLVTVVPDLPLTAIGKPYKLPLRADAARRAALDALAELPGIADVTAAMDGSAPVVTVTVDSSADRDAVATVLDQFTTAWRIEARHG
ncbi:acyl-CoA synthetase [Mycolicibacterium fluoranthenivorans]|uniref:Acyl-CoA synthetase n=1 Tax=Mycolicibacterium fluoranthenivorans TaxID=258505 RepID=A0A7G8PDS4_9MYCO|nr:acyl-CoA synthetase [Mycolicibacterium fluoranthenivorans]QNJ92490.1 acyl-CoA synthetase [Mycolicibacterium fluoranthenivorans]